MNNIDVMNLFFLSRGTRAESRIEPRILRAATVIKKNNILQF